MVKVNDTFEHQWSSTPGFFSIHKDQVISRHVEQNDSWFVSEKLDGCNMAVSSQGYIASRHKIIATRDEAARLKEKDQTTRFQGYSLQHVLPLFEAVDDLYDHLKTAFFSKHKFSLILYGEFMPAGTATCKFDIYNYVERGYEPGKMYAFGIGLLFESITDSVKQDVERIFRQAFLHSSTKQQPFYLVPIDWFLTGLFYRTKIDCVRLYSVQSLQGIFARSDFMTPLLERQLEGYILTGLSGQGMLKLKRAPKKNKFIDEHLALLEGMHKPTLATLKRIYNSTDTFVDTFEQEAFNACFSSIYEREKDSIASSIVKEVVHHDENFFGSHINLQTNRLFHLVSLALEDHYEKKLDPQVKCEVKLKIRNKLRLLVKMFYKTQTLTLA
jgi:hypothetical protein